MLETCSHTHRLAHGRVLDIPSGAHLAKDDLSGAHSNTNTELHADSVLEFCREPANEDATCRLGFHDTAGLTPPVTNRAEIATVRN